MPLLLVVVFVVVPIVELAVIVQVGNAIGFWPTLALLIADSVVGAWLLRREGRAAWRRFRAALDRARVPSAEVIDGALVIFGGALMLTPGFVTDVLGVALIVPPTRALASRAIRGRVRVAFGISRPSRGGAPSGAQGERRRRDDHGGDSDVLDVEVVKVERTPPE